MKSAGVKVLAAGLLTTAVLTACGSTTVGNPTPTGDSAAPSSSATEAMPAVTLDGLGNESPIDLQAPLGKPAVINLWASWCGPCKAELPILAAGQAKLGDRVRFIGIDFADESPAAARSLAKGAGVAYDLYVDPKSSVRGAFGVIGLPQTVFVDAQGTIVATERKAFRSSADLDAAIEKHLGVKP